MMQAPAFRNGKNDEARDAMIATFDALPRRAHGRKEIEKLLDKHRREWHLLAQTTSSDLIEYLQTLHLSVIDLTGEGHSQERVRYSWRDPTVFDGNLFPAQARPDSADLHKMPSLATLPKPFHGNGMSNDRTKALSLAADALPKPSDIGTLPGSMRALPEASSKRLGGRALMRLRPTQPAGQLSPWS